MQQYMIYYLAVLTCIVRLFCTYNGKVFPQKEGCTNKSQTKTVQYWDLWVNFEENYILKDIHVSYMHIDRNEIFQQNRDLNKKSRDRPKITTA